MATLDDVDEIAAALPGATKTGGGHGILFTIPHFDGYPAVLCRLDRVDREQLAELIADAWLGRVSKRVAQKWLAARGLEA